MAVPFRDRYDAGQQLAGEVGAFANRPDVLILGLPRGGVPVAYQVAEALDDPLDVCLVRKLGVPGHEELAMGAIASGGVIVLNDEVVTGLEISEEQIQTVVEREERELRRRERLYRDDLPTPAVRDRIVILVDDGLATGSTMRAAAVALRQQRPRRIVVAVPVAAAATCAALGEVADETICAVTPTDFYAVGLWYEDFAPTSDDEVRALLQRAWQRHQPVLSQAAGETEMME